MAAHRVHEQTIELTVRGSEATRLARELQDRLSLLQRRKLAAIIDRVCSELSPGDRVHRVESLELELGVIGLGEFEANVCRELELALRRGLGDAIFELDARGHGEAQAEGRSAFELLEHFALTGTLPWWADARRREIVGEALRALVEDPSPREASRRLLIALSDRREALARLVRASDDPILAKLFGRAFGSTGTTLAQIVTGLLASLVELPAALRERIWVLASSRAPRASSVVDLRGVVEELVELVARERTEGERTRLVEALAELGLELAPEAKGDASTRSHEQPELPARVAGPRSLARALLDSLTIDGDSVAPRVDSPRSPRTRAAADARQSDADQARSPSELAALASALLTSKLPNPALAVLLRRLVTDQAARPPETVRRQLVAALRELLEPSHPEAASSRGSPSPTTRAVDDALPVDNAGLVILWPFLARLFERTHLVLAKARAFVDDRSRARAVNVLHYLANEELGAPEFALPLNKLLCGLEPDAPLDAEGLLEPLEPELLAECDRMLQAVIAHAEILRDMTIPQLRASFLRREGVLRTRDGAWLLQVERQTHDLVLDRFPWSWSWLSLPWMPTPLRVEW